MWKITKDNFLRGDTHRTTRITLFVLDFETITSDFCSMQMLVEVIATLEASFAHFALDIRLITVYTHVST